MHLPPLLLLPLFLAATALSQTTLPEGYRQVIINTIWNAKFAVQAQTPLKAGSGIILYTVASATNPKPEQQWWIKDGNTKVQLAGTGWCLDAGSGRSNGSPLTIQECAATKASQNWVYQTEGSYLVLDQASGTKLCVDLYTGSVRDNTKIVLWQCINGDKNHQWPVKNVTATP
ncbi:ricin B lectin domain-containing protein [Sordaria brevicollis]|uniref:Ricin B lectin domain-containing protein n=1 Tax=Sordaria brevicollis TaxID=83679 RepID=A0AAE0U2D5_SORBR|nr:ricin B lectin domain-containing protein [Sordaria brevicollis]